MEFPDNPDVRPVEWIRVTVCEHARIYHEVTIGVPRGLSDDEVTEFLLEDRNQERIFKEENRTIEYLGTEDFDWLREGKEVA
jgi:hypothetical protein